MLPFLPRNSNWNRFCQLSAQQKRRLLPRAEFILHSRALPADGFPAYLHIWQQIFRQHRQRRNRPRNRHVVALAVFLPARAVLRAGVNERHVLNIQRIQHRLQEIQALLLRIHERHAQIRPCQRQRQPRKSRARADVNQRRALRNQFRNRQRHQAVDIVAVNHVRLFRHGGQIHLCVPFQQQFVVFQQLPRQIGREGNPAFRQALFQHFFRHLLHSSGR